MITLLLSTQNLTSLYQNVIGWIAVVIDVITALVMLYKAIKAKGITFQSFIDLLKTQKGRKRVSDELGKLIEQLEDATKAEGATKAEEPEQPAEDEEKPENEAKNEIHRTTD